MEVRYRCKTNIVTTAGLNNSRSQPCKSFLGLSQKENTYIVSLFVVTTKCPDSKRVYNIAKRNVQAVHHRLLSEGKMSITFKSPPHLLMISEANPNELGIVIKTIENPKYFLNLKLDNIPKVTKLGKEDVKTMTITCKAKYPTMHGVGFPKTLTSLTISGLNYRHLDLRICALETLEHLDLSNNALKKLPWSLWEMKRLSSLDLSNNFISDLPDHLPSNKNLCMNLKNLNMNSNWLDRFPEFLRHCNSLQTLQLANNFIRLIPNYMRACSSTLRVLNLAGCKLICLPACLNQFSLNELKIDDNAFPDHGWGSGYNTIYKGKCGNISMEVPSLRACCVKSIVQHSVPIPSDTELRCDVIDYINSVQYCAGCFKIVMENSLVYFQLANLQKFAREFSKFLTHLRPVIPGFVCSNDCFKRISTGHSVKPAVLFFDGKFGHTDLYNH